MRTTIRATLNSRRGITVLRAVAGGISQASADARYMALNTVKSVSPTTGQTVAFDANSVDQSLWVSAAGTLAALTVTLPPDANSRLGQQMRIGTAFAITALTINGATTILNNVTSLSANDDVTFEKIAANTWVLVQ